jgi:hypothetical protein
VREVTNLSTNFSQEFERQVQVARPPERRDREAGHDDIVVTGNACKR